MKKLLADNKFHLLAIAIIFTLFICSIFVRDKELNADLSAEQEWITSHILITNHVWEEGGGPSNYHFSPVYTFDGAGNKGIHCLGGVQDEDGDQYYVSYPPFAFLFAYYSTKVLGGSNIYSIRAVGLILHFFCCLLLYLTFKKLHNKKGDFIAISGITVVLLYLFSAGTLWMHSILYFSDMLVQLFVIWTLYLAVKIFKSEKEKNKTLLLSIGIIVFLGCYTEWLAVFLAFTLGLTFLIFFFKSKKRMYLHAFLIVGFSAALSISTTVVQYSSIAGFDALKEVSMNKYDERSGHENAEISAAGFNTDNPEAFEFLINNLTRNFWMVEGVFVIVAIAFVLFLLWAKTRRKIKSVKIKLVLIAVLLTSILMHYYFFFNFNALHNFSNLKTGYLIIMIIGTLVLFMEEGITLIWKAALTVFVLIIIGIKLPNAFERFHTFCQEAPHAQYYKFSADYVREHSYDEAYVFNNLPYNLAEYMYRAKRIPFRVSDTSQVKPFMDYFETDHCQYYHHDVLDLKYVLEYERIDDSIRVVKKTEVQATTP
jgi:Dolichyl-phosphate-mannose-protein mannosyltransferase